MKETIYLTYDQALDFVNRIAERTKNFDYEMVEPEKEAMAQLLSDVGVTTDDLIDVSNLADNYAINAEIVERDLDDTVEDYLFMWSSHNYNYYCLTW